MIYRDNFISLCSTHSLKVLLIYFPGAHVSLSVALADYCLFSRERRVHLRRSRKYLHNTPKQCRGKTHVFRVGRAYGTQWSRAPQCLSTRF